MYANSPFCGPAVEGAIATLQWELQRFNPAQQWPGSFVAGTGDVIMGHFGWGDGDSGQVLNTRTSPNQIQGFICRVFGMWTHVYLNESTGDSYLRQGLPCPLMKTGAFWAKFPGGAQAGQQVLASLVDGTCFSEAPGSIQVEATPYYVATNCPPNGLAVISTWSK